MFQNLCLDIFFQVLMCCLYLMHFWKEATFVSCCFSFFKKSCSKSLPLDLSLQLDNTHLHNKNRYILCFFLLLEVNGIFWEVYVNFMLVEHTHDDIGTLFGCWSMKLKKHDYSTIPLFIKSFMDAKSFL